MMRAVQLRSELIAQTWPLIERWVAAAVAKAKGNQSPAEIRAALEKGAMQLWLAWTGRNAKGCCVTELYETARGRTCGLVIVAGQDFSEWLPLTWHIREWARAQGCRRLEASGRPGWERRVRGDGWKPIRTTIEMPIDG
jgi:hypothetical protein